MAKKAFFIIQLLNGTVVFSVDSGTGPINTVYKPDDDENLCDGNWHTIKAIKSAYVVTVTVDNRSSEPAIGNEASLVTQTSRPLFVGGHPHIQKIRGLLARKPFYGCMRNIKINNVPEQINYSMMNGDVQLGTCPLN
jgi:laminin alpha 3/5